MNRHDYFKAFRITVLLFLLLMPFFVNFVSLNNEQATIPVSTPIPDQNIPSGSILNESTALTPTNSPFPSGSFIRDKYWPIKAFLPSQILPENPLFTTPETRVFTWISHSIDDGIAQWLFEIGFTDVCIRYVTFEQFKTSASLLAGYGITLWILVNPGFFSNDSSVEGFKNSIESVLAYRSHFIVDDCHSIFQNGSGWNESQKENFLAAVACYPNDVTLTFCEPEMSDWIQYNFSSVNIDLYCTPDQHNGTVVSSVKDNCLSLGIYLWIWNGSGINWGTVTQQQITQTYDIAKQYNANRLIVWMGNESDDYEQGMSLSSLYNYPEWYSFIAGCNWSFRNEEK
jgi:hypothetical protein